MIHLLAIMNVCTKFCANPSYRCLDILQDKGKLWPAGGATEKVGASLQSLEFILSDTMNVCTRFHGIRLIVVETFQSGSKWWTD